ncbi:MAG: NAD(P)/FAD-dependent oxidoreductase [Halanaeroarchaeum sp.]
MTDIGIVGAGVAGAAATYLLDRTLPDADLTVLERTDTVSGRAVTAERDGVVYDYGANYVTSDDDRVNELLTETVDAEGLVDVPEPIYVFDESGTVAKGREPDEYKWTYRSGLADLGRRLLDPTDASVELETTVAGLVRDRDAETWLVEDAEGGDWGPFDALVMSPPAPETARLLRGADWVADAREYLIEALEAVEFRTLWSAALHYPFGIDRPYYALVNTDKNHEVGWIAREECKPGHVPDGETLLVVQPSHEWSVEHYDDPPEANADALATHAAEIVNDDRLADPDWSDFGRWRFALADEAVAHGPVQRAWDHDLYPVGDWVAGEARLHAAMRNGVDVAERMVYRI